MFGYRSRPNHLTEEGEGNEGWKRFLRERELIKNIVDI
jgi:hypothetical protein